MGRYNSDRATADIVHELSARFQKGGPLEEMIEIQKEFHVFSQNNSLRQTFRLLHIVPSDFRERRLWYRYLDYLKTVPSDQEGVNGHDRIIKAYQENLESRSPLPMHTTTHRAADDPRVRVSRGRPIIYEHQDYLVISHPTIPRSERGGPPAAGTGSTPVAEPPRPRRTVRKRAR
jgi:hypothetical protein